MTESLRGRFLVAGPKLRDPNFFKTVVFVIEHAEDGAMGLVVNRPSSLTVGNALAGTLQVSNSEQMVYVGGPVEPADLFLLHNEAAVAEAFGGPAEIVDGVFVTNTGEQFAAVLCQAEAPIRNKVFSGYAGWGPGQLEVELTSGDWLIADGSPDDVYSTSAYELWDRLRESVHRSHRIVPTDVSNPEWN